MLFYRYIYEGKPVRISRRQFKKIFGERFRKAEQKVSFHKAHCSINPYSREIHDVDVALVSDDQADLEYRYQQAQQDI